MSLVNVEGGSAQTTKNAVTIESIQNLIDLFEKAKHSIPPSSQAGQITTVTATATASSSSANNNNPASKNKGKEIISSSKNEGKEKGTIHNSSSSSSSGSHPLHGTNQERWDQLIKWVADLIFIRNSISNLKNLEEHVNKHLDILQKQGQDLDNLWSDHEKVKEVTQLIMKLKLDIAYGHRINLGNNGASVSTVRTVRDLFKVLLNLEAYQQYKNWEPLETFEKDFNRPVEDHRRCLFYFSVFPEGAVVPKRLLMYWWIGEGCLSSQNDNDDEKVVDAILDEFRKKGYIETVVNNKRKLVGFKMHTLIRFAVIFLAEDRNFFSFDSTWYPTGDFLSSKRAVLVKNEQGVDSRDTVMSLDPQNLITLFNINDCSPDFELEWFLKMKNAEVVCLGRWEDAAARHNGAQDNSASDLKLEDTKFLKGLKNMKRVKFFSLRSVSGVHRLPKEILKLTSLTILDLRACRDLRALPESVESLNNLSHLDVSKCSLLDCMPKGIESLSKLQVLKGFVINNGVGAVDGLSKLTKLTKLSIRIKDSCTAEEYLKAIQGCTSLRKLTIECPGTGTTYGGTSVMKSRFLGRLSTLNANTQENNQVRRASTSVNRSAGALDPEFSFPEYLEKLDLRGLPETEATWLVPSKLKSLKKLYIRDGKLQNLNQDDKWNNVKILRLKSLPELKMKWRKVQDIFPELIYLEKVECPKMHLFPCHENGVWLNKKMLSEQSLAGLGVRWSFLSTKPMHGLSFLLSSHEKEVK